MRETDANEAKSKENQHNATKKRDTNKTGSRK